MKKKPSDPAKAMRQHSSLVLDGPERAPSRAMLYPVGFKPEDFTKPIVGIASTWSMVTPCNMHIDKLALEAEKGANEAGGKAIVFNTISVSDGIPPVSYLGYSHHKSRLSSHAMSGPK